MIPSKKVTQVGIIVRDNDKARSARAKMLRVKGAYSYIDGSKEIGCILELLENYK